MCEDEGLYRSHPKYNGENIKEICKFSHVINKIMNLIFLFIFSVLLSLINIYFLLIFIIGFIFLEVRDCSKKCCNDILTS